MCEFFLAIAEPPGRYRGIRKEDEAEKSHDTSDGTLDDEEPGSCVSLEESSEWFGD